MADELIAALDAWRDKLELRVVILTGSVGLFDCSHKPKKKKMNLIYSGHIVRTNIHPI